ncbi:unnamed protein product, partial [Effrenium voratum]
GKRIQRLTHRGEKMELLVDHVVGLPEDAVLSVRCGGTRRQAPLNSVASQPLKFPGQLSSMAEPLKVDVLRPVASARLVLHPKEDLYSLSFDNDAALGIKITGATDTPEPPSNPKEAANCAKDYLEEHGLLKYMQSMLHAVIQVKPEDPYAYMMEQLTCAQSRAGALQKIASRPSSALRRPKSALAPSPVSPSSPASPASPATAPQAPQAKQAQAAQAAAAAAPLVPVPPASRPENCRPRPKPETPAKPSQANVEEFRNQLREKLEQAHQSGTLEGVVQRAVRPCAPDAPESKAAAALVSETKVDAAVQRKDLDSLRAEAAATLVSATKDGSLDAALQRKDLGGLREEAAATLVAATKDGRLDAALQHKELAASEALVDEAARLEAMIAVQNDLRNTLFDAIESDSLLRALEEVRSGTFEAEPWDASEADGLFDLQLGLRAVFADAAESGQLSNALQLISPQEQKEVEEIKDKMRKMLEDSLSSGSLEETLGKIKSKSVQDDSLQIKATLMNRLSAAADSGELQEVLRDLPEDLKGAREDPEDTKRRLRELLETAAESGQLQVALDLWEKGHEPDLNALQAELGVMKEENRSLAETIDKLMDQMGSLKKENEKLTQVVKGQ